MTANLDPEQEDLLKTLVEAQRSVPRPQRRKVIVGRMLQGDVMIHPGIPKEKRETYFGDLEILERYGLISITYPGRDPNIDVTPEGYALFDSLGQPADTKDPNKTQEELASDLLSTLDEIKVNGYRSEHLIQRAKVLNAQLAPSYAKIFGAVPLISTDYPPRIWWSRARENASQALAVAAAGGVDKEPRGEALLVAESSRRVFIVHGHEHGLKEAVARLVEREGYEAVILHEKPNSGRTIIEKFEQEADAAFAVILLTPDDEGRVRTEEEPESELALRARQNVVWEFGYFSGAIGRGRVAALSTDDALERPSDLQGVLYIPVTSVQDMEWRLKLVSEMRSAGLEVDLNKLVE